MRKAQFDGKSILPLLVGELDEQERSALPNSVSKHLESLGSYQDYAAGWREYAYIEYYFVQANVKCCGKCGTPKRTYPNEDSWCGVLTTGANSDCWSAPGQLCKDQCYPTEDNQNNFRAVRGMPGSETGDVLYAEYQTGDQTQANVNFTKVDFVELFDISSDPWQMHNLANNSGSIPVPKLKQAVAQFYNCAGDTCP